MSQIKKCPKCKTYTLNNLCKKCKTETESVDYIFPNIKNAPKDFNRR